MFQTVEGVIATLEIRNPREFINVFSEISETVRTMPAIIMVAATSKVVIILVINVVIFIAVLIAGWNIVEENQRQQILRRADFDGVARSNPDFTYTSLTPSLNYPLSDMVSSSDPNRQPREFPSTFQS